MKINPPTEKTPVLAALALSIAQTHLLEMLHAEGPGGKAEQAFRHVQEAFNLITPDSERAVAYAVVLNDWLQHGPAEPD